MPFPTHKPTARQFDAGDWPSKSFKSQSGVEVRILYGSQRTGMSLDLTYSNVTDAAAEQFLVHYQEVQGTYGTFTIPPEAKAGWAGNTQALDVTGSGNRWRYAGPPQVTSVKPGRSSVQVQLVGVL